MFLSKNKEIKIKKISEYFSKAKEPTIRLISESPSKFESSKLNTNTFKRKVSQCTDNYTTGFEKYQEEFNKKFKKNKNMEDKNKSNNIAEEKKKMQELINRLEQKYKKNSDISDPLKLKVEDNISFVNNTVVEDILKYKPWLKFLPLKTMRTKNLK